MSTHGFLVARCFGAGFIPVDARARAPVDREVTADLVAIAADALMESLPGHVGAFAVWYVGDRGRSRYRVHMREGLHLEIETAMSLTTASVEHRIVLTRARVTGPTWTKHRHALSVVAAAFFAPTGRRPVRARDRSSADERRGREAQQAASAALARVMGIEVVPAASTKRGRAAERMRAEIDYMSAMDDEGG